MPILRSTVALTFGALLIPSLCAADRIDDIVRAEAKLQGLPGVTVTVVQNGRIVKLKGYGEANVELHVPASGDTVYQSGSVGKQFTATLTMMLIQDGKLGLDDQISKWFPEGGAAWSRVTVRHLLSHTSGLADMPYDKMDLTKEYSEDDFVKLMAAQTPVEAPGTKWRYNNGGFVMLGVLIHRLTGKFYGDLLQERIFGPLGMTTARIISERDIVPNRATGYAMTDKGLKNQSWVSPSLNTTADGSLYLTALDYVKWDAGLRSEKLLPKSALEQMWTAGKLADGSMVGPKNGTAGTGYGFGWELAAVPGHRLIEHGGAWQGFTTYIGRMLDTGETIIVLTNLDAGHARPSVIAQKIFAISIPSMASKQAASSQPE